MPANIPSPVVGAGGQGSRPWWESMLLTLAQQGPDVLMGFLDRRQQAAQQAAIDTAAQGALQTMAASGTPEERAAMTGAGARLGAPTVQGVTAPSGLQTPTIAPMTPGAQRADFSGMQSGVASPLLEMLSQLRTERAQQNAAAASADASRAGAEATRAENVRAGERHPLEMQRIRSETAATEATTAARTLEGRLAQQRLDLEDRMFDLDVERVRAAITADKATTARVKAETNSLASELAAAHRKEYQTLYSQMRQTFANLMPKEEIEAEVNELVFGTPMAPTASELNAHYSEVVSSGQLPDLASVVRERIMQRFRMTPENVAAVMSDLRANRGDARATLLANFRLGASIDDLRAAAWVYTLETGVPVTIPIEVHRQPPEAPRLGPPGPLEFPAP